MQVFLDGAVEAGHPFTEDVNGFQQEGVGWFDMTIRDGKRWSAASAYLRPALEGRNDERGFAGGDGSGCSSVWSIRSSLNRLY